MTNPPLPVSPTVPPTATVHANPTNKERQFLQQKFRDYYRQHLYPPLLLHTREFGFGFERKIEYRHKSFETENGLQEFIQREAPFFMSYSAAFYRYPAAQPMEKKEFTGAELIFDLDAGYEHEGHNPLACPYCLERVRDETLTLVEDFLLKDFGFSEKEVSANFSGQKGYHVHVDSEAVRQLSQEARKQLSNYVTASGLDLSKVFLKVPLRSHSGRAVQVLRGPDAFSKGWNGKLYRKVRLLIEHGDAQAMRKEGLKPSQIKFVLENKEAVLEKMSEGNWDLLKGMEATWKGLMERTLALKSVKVDEKVSYDMARLIRLPDSLHGDTGFIAKKVPLKELAAFDPLRQALAFSETSLVKVKSIASGPLSFTLQGQSFALEAGEEKELPENAAVFLLCKRKAVLL